VNVDRAYKVCEEITAAQARNFAYGIKLLPGPKRRAMSALYALARRIDDIGDGDAPVAEKLEGLAAARKDVARLPGAADPDDPVMVAVADACRRYPIPVSALEELIDGCEMDVCGARYDTFTDLIGYCRRVAGTVGRMSLSIYGCADPKLAEPLADDLGVALQLTNILRDIREDHDQLGRVYLPAEDLTRFGVGDDLDGPEDALVAVVAFETGRAEEWFERGLPLLGVLDRRSRSATAAMTGIYRQLLREIRRDPAAVLSRRVSLRAPKKVAIAARALLAGGA
jgi:phytoene synthase